MAHAFLSTTATVSVVVIACICLYYYSNFSVFFNTNTQNHRRVIVVGGGLAGLAAVVEAHRGGAHVTLLEKQASLGGNSAKASSGINAVRTLAQLAFHSEDTPEAFVLDTLNSGSGKADVHLVEVLVNKSAAAIEFLASFGVDLSELSKCGGHTHARTHRAKPPTGDQPAHNIGFEITRKLIEYVANIAKENSTKGSVKIIINAKAVKLITDDDNNTIVGTEYVATADDTYHKIYADAVILTTGGYAADRKGLLEKYAPKIANLSTTNGPWALGEGIRIAQEVGAKLVLMDKVQVHPTSFVDPKDPFSTTKFLAPEALRAVGGIVVDKQGRRFVDELSLRNVVTSAIFEHGFQVHNGPVSAYMLLNNEAVNMFGISALKFYKSKGFIVEYANAKTFTEAAGMNCTTLVHTLESYNAAQQRSGPDEFGVAINTQAQVLHEDESVIKGLYSAGETSGGVHGNNRLAGNSLLECVVFGRIAGQQVSK